MSAAPEDRTGSRSFAAPWLTPAVIGILVCGALAACALTPPGPSLILISIDTLRADHLGAYGYDRRTSPVLDRLAAESVLFESVISQAPWTLPSHVTLLSSLYPSTHKAVLEDTSIDPSIPTLATVLQASGFATAAYVDHVFVSSIYGFDRGFDQFDEQGGGVAAIVERAAAWLRRERPDRFFLFLHLFDVHCPYTPPPGYREMFRSEASVAFDLEGKCGNPHFNRGDLQPGQVAYLIDQYDGEIAHLDARLGLFFTDLDTLGLTERTVLMVTSDHGEEFFEHGQIGHERTVHDEVMRVPWILRVPGTGARRIAPTVRLLDLAPTALDLLGIPVPAGFQGRSLAAWIDGEAGVSLPAFGELDRHVRMRSLHLGPNHLIRTDPASGSAGAGADSSSPRFQLYDIMADRPETDDLIDTETGRSLAPELKRRLAEIEAAAVAAGRPFRAGDLSHLNEERRRQLEEQLRSLGYLP